MDVNKKRPLIILTGPTAVGKTALSIELAKRLNGEIISADSMQVYKHMDIGTAKIKPEEMQGIRHHLIDLLEPFEEFNIAHFQKTAKDVMEDIYKRGNCPIIVGGTGFYIQAVLYDIQFTETTADVSYREELEKIARTEGTEILFELLRKTDPVSCETIHPNNIKRVIRALEYYKQTGEPISKHNEIQKCRTSPYEFRYYVLSLDRKLLYERINKRVDKMREDGLIDEVTRLLQMGCTEHMVSMQGLGYKEIIDALKGRDSMEHAFERIKQETRHFAKRQFTWFRREKDVTWLNKDSFSSEQALLEFCVKDCAFVKEWQNELKF